MFLFQFFLKINAGARKTTNHQKINTVLHRGNAKCDGQEAFARGTIETPLMKNSSFLTGHRLAVQRKNKQTKDVHLRRSLLPLFRVCSPSLQTSERALTDIANERAQESDRAMVGPPAPSSQSRSTFCPQSYHTLKNNCFGDFSSETCP